ncbi:OX-2 membrane glycoprotein isoform X1 [Notechis scutatus]|uniref:OX-2 membrane glycoprotein isoform X1 n=1 Tax=Notechis scutatus TaxID=8663 RepID=A0A6J1TPH7_9SAUR|nr:OX-2 membrane glycoprotein isoform X1 [Notechis scutatus]
MFSFQAASHLVCSHLDIFQCDTEVIYRPVQTITTGKNVTLFCQLAKNHDIVQVTWQKNQINIATYSKAYGAKILSNQSNIHLSQNGLTFSAITFNGVTFKDEDCYSCIFNTFPLGPFSGKTCLKVYALTEPEINVRQVPNLDNMEKIREINCSVTGRPAPVITWKMKKPLQIKPKSHMISHSNKTVTVISTFTQVLSKTVSENSVICVIQHPSLNASQELMLSEIVSKQAPNKHQRIVIATVCILVSLFVLGLFIFFIYWYRRRALIEKEQDLPCWVVPLCSGRTSCRKNGYTKKKAPMKSLAERKFLDT